jgi:Tol biopolymer transport system component
VINTATPSNRATATYRVEEATAIAVVFGTFTPLPTYAVTATPSPLPTSLPLIMWEDALTPRPHPTATAAIPADWPAAMLGKILFMSNRDNSPRLMMLDPATGRAAFITQDWPARKGEQIASRSPDGRFELFVQPDARGVRQVFVQDLSSGTWQQLTSTTGPSHDPAWSPLGDRIVLVTQEAGRSEIFTIALDGSDARRLTTNARAAHPSWSSDGTEILFGVTLDTGQRQLGIMNADGSNQRALFQSPYDEWDPIWIR